MHCISALPSYTKKQENITIEHGWMGEVIKNLSSVVRSLFVNHEIIRNIKEGTEIQLENLRVTSEQRGFCLSI